MICTNCLRCSDPDDAKCGTCFGGLRAKNIRLRLRIKTVTHQLNLQNQRVRQYRRAHETCQRTHSTVALRLTYKQTEQFAAAHREAAWMMRAEAAEAKVFELQTLIDEFITRTP